MIDHFHRTGWSVLVRGVAPEFDADEELALHPWIAGVLAPWVGLVLVAVTGRWLSPHADESSDARGYL